MELLTFLLLLLLLLFWRSRSRARIRRKGVRDPGSHFRSKPLAVLGTIGSDVHERPQTGSVTKSHTGDWVLNPAATFPITISGVDQWTAEKVKDLLEEGYTTDLFKVARALEQLIARSNLRCKQVDDYILIFKPQYFRKIEMLKQS